MTFGDAGDLVGSKLPHDWQKPPCLRPFCLTTDLGGWAALSYALSSCAELKPVTEPKSTAALKDSAPACMHLSQSGAGEQGGVTPDNTSCHAHWNWPSGAGSGPVRHWEALCKTFTKNLFCYNKNKTDRFITQFTFTF